MVGAICAVSSLSVSSTTRRTGAEIEPASSRAPAAFSSACSAASAPLALSARNSALETSVGAPEQESDDVDLGQRRIGAERQGKAARRARHAERDAEDFRTIALRRGADPRFRLDVEERLDAGDGLMKSMRAARHEVAVALEQDVAAFDLGAAEQQRPIVGALQPQVGAGDHVARGCSGSAAWWARRPGRRSGAAAPDAPAGPAGEDGRAAGQVEDVRVGLEAPSPDGVVDDDGARRAPAR